MSKNKANADMSLAFFEQILFFYKENKAVIRQSYRDLTKKYLDFNDSTKNIEAFLRTPQFEALEIYVFLKEFLHNSKIEDIFAEWWEGCGKFANRRITSTSNDMLGNVTEQSYSAVFKDMKANSRQYPNYIFALTMGTGKTILMATCIFYEFLLANKWPKDVIYCHNALVFAPDKTVLESLKEVKTFDLTLVVPKEYVPFLSANIKFHYLTDDDTSLSTIDNSKYNIIVSNTQKIILKKQHKVKSAVDTIFNEPNDFIVDDVLSEVEMTALNLTSNQRFEKISRLGQLGIYVDEAHHLFGDKLAKDMGLEKSTKSLTQTSLRITIDSLSKELSDRNQRVVACYNFTGTPYSDNKVLPEVVYSYGLQEAIQNKYLKKVKTTGYDDVKNEDFVLTVINDFLDNIKSVDDINGRKPKLAFFASDISDLTNHLKPAVQNALLKLGLSSDLILVNTGDPSITSNDDIREFNSLDSTTSKKQFILLVNKGREGWNCKSLFGVALFRKPKSTIFVLQATMRCLRQIGSIQHTGFVYLSRENYSILDEELNKNFKLNIDSLKNTDSNENKKTINLRVKLPPKTIEIRRKKIEHKLTKKEIIFGSSLGLFPIDTQDFYKLTEKYYQTKITSYREDLRDIGTLSKEEKIIIQKNYCFSRYLLIAEIARYMNLSPILIEEILVKSQEGIDVILSCINKFNQLIYDILVPNIFKTIYDIDTTENFETKELKLIKLPKDGSNSYSISYKDDLLIMEHDSISLNNTLLSEVKNKSFHLDGYSFDSKPERDMFINLIFDNNVEEVYFTGMLTHEQTEFFIQYIDPETDSVRKYYPDFLMKTSAGKYLIIEVKGRHMLDDPITKAKEDYAKKLFDGESWEYKLIPDDQVNFWNNSTFMFNE